MKGNKMIALTASQKRKMKAEAVKEAAWSNSALSMDRIMEQAQAMSNARKNGMGTLRRGRKINGSSRGGKIAIPVGGSGSASYVRLRLQKVG